MGKLYCKLDELDKLYCKFDELAKLKDEFDKLGKLYCKLDELDTLPPAYLSCEFAFYVRFQRVVRALSLNCV